MQLHYAATGLNAPGKFRGSGKATESLHRKPQNRLQTRNTRANPTCYCCGATHLASECRFKNAECCCCKKLDTLQKVCDSKPPRPSPRPTHYMQEDDIPQTDQDSTYELFMIKEATRDPIILITEQHPYGIRIRYRSFADLNQQNSFQ